MNDHAVHCVLPGDKTGEKKRGVRLGESEIARVRQNGRHLSELFSALSDFIEPGIRGSQIDRFVGEFLAVRDLKPALDGYRSFPGNCCINPGAVAVHGPPTDQELPAGEIVTVDVSVEREGWFADAAWTYAVGPIDADRARLLKGAYAACLAGISVLKSGTSFHRMASAVRTAAGSYGLRVLPACCGHGIGRSLHEPPLLPYDARGGNIEALRTGHFHARQLITVEPVVTLRPQNLELAADGFSLVGTDGAPCAQFEHTVVIYDERSRTLTAPSGPDVDFPPYF